jgi:hypothetical protein
MIVIRFTVQATVGTTVNYNRNRFILQATVDTTVKYNCNRFILQATMGTTINYNRNMFVVKATEVTCGSGQGYGTLNTRAIKWKHGFSQP